MDLLQMKIFVYAAKCSNFSQVANHLYISQSSVSKYISSLESELGYSLFNRSGKAVSLTQFGKGLLPYAENLLSAQDELMEFSHAQKSGEDFLSVGIPDDLSDGSNIGFFRAYFNAVHRLYAENPHIRIRTRFFECREMFNLLHRKKISAICIPILDEKDFNDNFPPSGRYCRLSHTQHYLTLGSGLVDCCSLDDLQERVKTIYYVQSEVPNKILDELLHRFSMTPEVIICRFTMELLTHVIDDEPYSVALIESHLLPMFQDLDITLYPLSRDGISSSFYLVWEKSSETPIIQRLGDLLYQFLNAEQHYLNAGNIPKIYSEPFETGGIHL